MADTVAGKKIKQLEMAEELYETDELVIEDEKPKTKRTTLQKLYTWIVKQAMLAVYPVGTVYLSMDSTNPSKRFGGTWESLGAGRTLFGVDTSQNEFNAVEKIGGSKTIDLSHHHVESIGSDSDNFFIDKGGNGASYYGSTVVARNGQCWANPTATANPIRLSYTSKELTGAKSILPPYITCYMWKRTE